MAFEATPAQARAVVASRDSAAFRAAMRIVSGLTRLAVLLVAVFAALSFGPASGGLARENADKFDEPALTHALADPLLAPLARWDSVWYLRIADSGYGDSAPRAAFFPLYPLLVRARRHPARRLARRAARRRLPRLARRLPGGARAAPPAHGARARAAAGAARRCCCWRCSRPPSTSARRTPRASSCCSRWARSTRRGPGAGPGRVRAPGSRRGTRSAGPPAPAAARADLVELAAAAVAATPPGSCSRRSASRPTRLARPRGGRRAPLPGRAGGVVARARRCRSRARGTASWRRSTGCASSRRARARRSTSRQAAGDPFRIAAINVMLFATLVFAVAACVGVLRRLPRPYGVWVAASLVLPLTFPVAPQPLMSLPRFVACCSRSSCGSPWYARSGGRTDLVAAVVRGRPRPVHGPVRELALDLVTEVRAVLLDALGTLVELQPPAPRLRRLLRESRLRGHRGAGRGRLRRGDRATTSTTTSRARTASGSSGSATAAPRRCGGRSRSRSSTTPRRAGPCSARSSSPPTRTCSRRSASCASAGSSLVIASNWDCSLPDWLRPTGHPRAGRRRRDLGRGGRGQAEPARVRAGARGRAGVAPAEALHVGDKVDNDVEGAAAAGVRGRAAPARGRAAARRRGDPLAFRAPRPYSDPRAARRHRPTAAAARAPGAAGGRHAALAGLVRGRRASSSP